MQHRRIIKRGPVVVATQEDGSIDPAGASSQGLFVGDTRFLSHFCMKLNGLPPLLLGSSEETLFQASYLHTNPELTGIPARAIGLLQRNRIERDTVIIDIRLVNWSLHAVELELTIELEADFYDSFEARGATRPRRGQVAPPVVTDGSLELAYTALDGVETATHITAAPPFARFDGSTLFFPIKLEPNARAEIALTLRLTTQAPGDVKLETPIAVGVDAPRWFGEGTRITTNNDSVNALIQRGVQDLEILLTDFDDVWVPVAGLPRFAVPFGRDCLLTGIETLVWNPRLSRDVLHFLAERQGKEENPWNYEQPGKIMHEMHTGELARLKEVPFGLFYGSVDATVLFLVLGAEYLRWTKDLKLYRALKGHFAAAWRWVDDYGNMDGSGYVQYRAHTPPAAGSSALTVGLFNQGWKDSSIALAYGDGTMVTDHPIALAEVQGYLYRALQLWGQLYAAMPAHMGKGEEGARLLRRADELAERFHREFWMEDKGYYAMALDGDHRHVDSITSNPGHCLWARLLPDEPVETVAKTLMSERMLSSWGIRTMANDEPAYNPFSYHNGSVWPFENALIASGLMKYGFAHEAHVIFDALVKASLSFEYRRWPEVYCGVSEAIGGVLARQPDASRPQAWSAAAIFTFLQTWLGLAPQPFSHHIDVTPSLPPCLTELRFDNLSIAGCRLGLRLVREDNGPVLVQVTDNPSGLDITIHPATRGHHRAAHAYHD